MCPQGWNKDSASSPWNGLWRPWSTKCKICSLSFTIADGWIFRLSQEARLFISLLSSSQSATDLPSLWPESCDESQSTTFLATHILAKICLVPSSFTWSTVNTSCTPGKWPGYYLAYWRISYLAHLFASIRGSQSLPEAYISSQLVSIYLRWEYILGWYLQSFSK